MTDILQKLSKREAAKIVWRNDRRKLKDLVAWEHNPRQISEAAGKLLAASLDEFGQIQTIAIEADGTIVDGHQRESVWLASDKFGPDYEVDVRVASRKLTNKERGRLVTMLHEGTVGDWNFDLLANMPDMDIEDFVAAGFDEKVLLDEAFNTEEPVDAEPQIIRADELQKEWKTERGQLWGLGDHRLLCGDCLKESDIDLLLRGDEVNFVYSDAPYGISIVNSVGKVSTGLPVGPALCRTKPSPAVGGDKAFGKVGGDKAFGKVVGIHKGMKARPIIASNLYAKIIGDDDGKTAREAFTFLHVKFPKALHVWWGANHFSEVFPASSCWIVWDKENGESFFADAELAWCSAKTAVRIFKHMWNGLIKASERGESRCHPTQKPVALAVWCLENYGKAGDVVLDPFSGSASCLLGCENTGRKCRAIELDPGYVAVALQRFKSAFPEKEIKRL